MARINEHKIDLEYIGLLILACFPLYPFFIVSVAVFLYAVLTFLNYFKSFEKRLNKSVSKQFFILQIGFLLYLIVVSSIKNSFSDVLKYIEPSLSLLIFPVVWLVSNKKISKKKRDIIFKTFTASSFLLGLLITLYSIYFSIKKQSAFTLVYNQISFLDIHPNYVGLYFFISFVFLFLEYKPNFKKFKLLKWLLIVFFLWLIFALSSRIVILSILFFLTIEFIKTKSISIKKKVFIFILSFIFLLSLTFFIKSLHKKVTETIALKELSLPNKKWPTSTEVRVGLIYCANPIILNNWVFGVGVISFEERLNNCYSQFENAQKIRYNLDNYYLFLLGSAGIFCLGLLFIMLFQHYIKSFLQRDLIYFYFLISITLSLATENLFSRLYGAVFTMFFMTIFVKRVDK